MNPWNFPNWLETVQTWLSAHFPSIAPIQPSHVWAGAFCGTTTLNGQKLHFKALPTHLLGEPRITAFLQAFSSSLPTVLAIEPEHGWLLTQSAGETHLVRDPKPEHWCLTLRCMAEL